MMKHHDSTTYRKRNLFGLPVPEEWEPIIVGRLVTTSGGRSSWSGKLRAHALLAAIILFH